MIRQRTTVLFVLFLLAAGPLALAQTPLALTQPKSVAQTSKHMDQDPLEAFPTFSATLNGGIGNDHNRKIYRSGDLMRGDFDDSYRIGNLKTHRSWGVFPDHCVQVPGLDAATYPFRAYDGYKVQRSETGQAETVDGHACRIENATFTSQDGLPEVKMKLWEAEDLQGFPIKIEVVKGGSHTQLTYTNVSLAIPDPKLFHHPARCQQVFAAPPQGAAPLHGQSKSTPKSSPQPQASQGKNPPQ